MYVLALPDKLGFSFRHYFKAPQMSESAKVKD